MCFSGKFRFPLISIVVISFILMPGFALAITRIVDADDPDAFPNIQTAINVSSSGDIVFVRCGFYQENITMVNGVNVIGESPDCVFIDGGNAGPVVTLTNIDFPTELSGFTIQNGRSFEGGGIRIRRGDPIISRNFIVANEAELGGTGFYSGTGGGIYVYDAFPTITNNLISGNLAEFAGAGVGIIGYSSILTSNTIVGNLSYQAGAGFSYGGGVYSFNSGVYITSNILYGNSAEAGAGGVDLFNSCWQLTYNDDFQNTPFGPSLVPKGGCSSSFSNHSFIDPLFLNSPGSVNMCLRSDSPLLDAGPMAGTTDLVDFFGRPRHLDGNFDGLARVDMGYCEGGDITNVMVSLVGPGQDVALDWDPSVNSGATFNIYRGLLSELRSSCAIDCIYTQTIPLARQDCNRPSGVFTFTYLSDTDNPPLGDAFIYLITGKDFAEGTLGFRNDLEADLNLGVSRQRPERTNHNPCP